MEWFVSAISLDIIHRALSCNCILSATTGGVNKAGIHLFEELNDFYS